MSEGDFTRYSAGGTRLTRTGYGYLAYGEGPYGGQTVASDAHMTWTPETQPAENVTFLSGTGQAEVRGGYGTGGYGMTPYGTGDTLNISLATEAKVTWTPFTQK